MHLAMDLNRSIYISMLTFMFTLLLACDPGANHKGSKTFITDSPSGPILGGTAVSPQEPLAKSTVQILSFQVHRQRDGLDHVLMTSTCTGTLIAPDLVITAAHCISPNARQTWVYFSTQIPRHFEDLLLNARTHPKLRQVTAMAVTKLWNPKDHETSVPAWADIALFKLSGTIPPDALIASLAPAAMRLTTDEPLLVAGYGIVDTIKKSDAGNLQKVQLTVANPQIKTGEFLVNTTTKLGICGGDSGGPAYVQRNGQWLLAGIISRPELKPTESTPMCDGQTILTDVSYFAKWIQETALVLRNSPKSGLVVN